MVLPLTPLVSDGTVAPAAAESGGINVMAYGAAGNGRRDDTSAIQEAANDAARQGVQLFFPPGTYNVSAALRMADNATWLASPGTATLIATADNTIIASVNTANDTVSGLTLQGSKTTAGSPPALLIAYKATGFSLVAGKIQNTSGIGALFSNVDHTIVYGSTFSNVGENTGNLENSAQGVAFTNDIPGFGKGNSVIESKFFLIGLDAISATGQTSFTAISNTIDGGKIDPGWATQSAGAAGVYSNENDGLVIAGNIIENVSGNGIDVDNSANIEIYQNNVSGSGSAGIAVFSATGGSISWNATTNNNVIDHFACKGGIVDSSSDAASIVISHNISGNTGSSQTQPFGIQVIDKGAAGRTTLTITPDNLLTGNTSAPISDIRGGYVFVPESELPPLSYPVGVNHAPVIGGIEAVVSTTTGAIVKPFAYASITALDVGVTEEICVTIHGGEASGKLSGAEIAATSTPGTYAIGASGITAFEASALLRGAVFTPAASQTILTITAVQISPTSPTTVSSSATSIVAAKPIDRRT